MPAVLLLDRAAARRIDDAIARGLGLPTIVLMENAAIAVARAAIQLLRPAPAGGPPGPVFILCGKGNNGGDGLAAARHLHLAGIPVAIILAAPAPQFRGDARVHARVAKNLRIPIFTAAARRPDAAFQAARSRLGPPTLIIDALLGTGLDRPVDAASVLAGLIACINRARSPSCRVLAVDLPSGLDCDTGRPLVHQAAGSAAMTAVVADLTITMVAWKAGFLKPAARPYLGSVAVAGIGAPAPKRPPRPRRRPA